MGARIYGPGHPCVGQLLAQPLLNLNSRGLSQPSIDIADQRQSRPRKRAMALCQNMRQPGNQVSPRCGNSNAIPRQSVFQGLIPSIVANAVAQQPSTLAQGVLVRRQTPGLVRIEGCHQPVQKLAPGTGRIHEQPIHGGRKPDHANMSTKCALALNRHTVDVD